MASRRIRTVTAAGPPSRWFHFAKRVNAFIATIDRDADDGTPHTRAFIEDALTNMHACNWILVLRIAPDTRVAQYIVSVRTSVLLTQIKLLPGMQILSSTQTDEPFVYELDGCDERLDGPWTDYILSTANTVTVPEHISVLLSGINSYVSDRNDRAVLWTRNRALVKYCNHICAYLVSECGFVSTHDECIRSAQQLSELLCAEIGVGVGVRGVVVPLSSDFKTLKTEDRNAIYAVLDAACKGLVQSESQRINLSRIPILVIAPFNPPGGCITIQ